MVAQCELITRVCMVLNKHLRGYKGKSCFPWLILFELLIGI